MIEKGKVLLLVMCFMMIGLIASLTSGCAGGGGGGGGGGGEKPQYGGVLTLQVAADPVTWDDTIQAHYTTSGPYECLWSGDWAKGIAGGYGSKVCDWLIPGAINRMEGKTGYIAESWEIGDDYIIFHLRDGVHWQNKAPPKGRLVTADDVVFSLQRNQGSGAYLAKAYPKLAAAMSVSKVDEHTVRIDCTKEEMPELITLIDFMYIYPKDVIETYGDMNDPDRAIGTGAFSLKEYVPGSSLYYERSSNYWRTNPVGPGAGDQLPYLDGIRVLIQPDPSTVDSLFKTGELDALYCDCDRAQEIKADCPDVKYVKFFGEGGARVIFMRLDKADLPYQDVRVRQALQLAIDGSKLVNELYGGEGEILYWPVYPCKEYAGAYLELKDYPAEVQELFTQNIDNAKQLLSDAGYPDGFKADIVVYNYYFDLDSIQAVKDMLHEIGVDLTIKLQDYATWTTTWYFRSYTDMYYGSYSGVGTYFKGINWSGTSMFNASYVNDPTLNDYRDQMLAAYPDEAKCDQIHTQMLPYLIQQCYVIQTAGADYYRMWWPWVKNYDGEMSVGYYKALSVSNNDACVWIDEDLKAEMGYGD
jgi:peptide/nickel transport system substrate-binding protein